MPFKNLKLNDGTEAPAIAFGTGTAFWKKEAVEAVKLALELGFTHIDTAQVYGNEESVATAIEEIGADRNKLYITTKWGGGTIRTEIETSLKKLNLKQVDLYLLHHPRLIENGMENVWREFEKIKEDGLSKSIGISNFNLEQTKELLKVAKIKPAANQIRLHPYNWEECKELVEFSAEQGIVIEAYSALTPLTKNPGGPVDPVLKTIGTRLGATPAQVIFAWLKSKGVLIVTTTRSKERIIEYLNAGDLPDLTKAEIAAIEEAGAKWPRNSDAKKT